MQVFSFILLLLSFNCVANDENELISKSWLKEEVNLEYIHQYNFRICERLKKLGFNKGRKCTIGSGNVFKAGLSDLHKIYLFARPEEDLKKSTGVMSGFALTLNESVIEIIVTSES